VTAHEGELVRGYRITRIDPHEVEVQRDGLTFTIRPGNPRPAQGDDERSTVAIPYQRKKPVVGTFVAPPDNIGEIRQQATDTLERLRQNPEFAPLLERARRRIILETR
jgi:hypothetical protein